MADQVKAPEKKAKSPFGTTKQPTVIIYRLDKVNERLRDDTPLYPPYIRFPNTDIISWNFGTDAEPDWNERAIRFLPGFNSIFVDEQEKGGREIPQNVLDNPSNRFEVVNGEIKVRPHEKTKMQFLDICNRNSKSLNRTGKVVSLFSRYSEEGVIKERSEKQKKQQEAIQKAFSASEEQIAFHAKYLGVPMIDHSTSASRTFEAVRTDYQQIAIDQPEKFIETYDDEDLRLKYFIGKAIEGNLISLTIIPGKAVWAGNKEEVCDIAPGSTPIDSIFNFCQLKSGEDTLKKLKEYNK